MGARLRLPFQGHRMGFRSLIPFSAHPRHPHPTLLSPFPGEPAGLRGGLVLPHPVPATLRRPHLALSEPQFLPEGRGAPSPRRPLQRRAAPTRGQCWPGFGTAQRGRNFSASGEGVGNFSPRAELARVSRPRAPPAAGPRRRLPPAPGSRPTSGGRPAPHTAASHGAGNRGPRGAHEGGGGSGGGWDHPGWRPGQRDGGTLHPGRGGGPRASPPPWPRPSPPGFLPAPGFCFSSLPRLPSSLLSPSLPPRQQGFCVKRARPSAGCPGGS